MPTEETPRQKKQASKPDICDSIVEKSRKLSCTISRSLACVCPVGLRPIASTLSTSASSRHSRSTTCPTIPVAPNRMTFISISCDLVAFSSEVGTGSREENASNKENYSGGGRDRIERYTGQRGRDIPRSRRHLGLFRVR